MAVDRILLKGGSVLTLDPVDSVFIAGKARKRRGQLLDVDLERVKRLAYQSRDYVVEKSGFTLPAI